MSKADKIALYYILTSFSIGVVFTLKAVEITRKDKAAKQADVNAKNYATAQVIKMFLIDKVKTREDYEREWQFAYMNYRAHH